MTTQCTPANALPPAGCPTLPAGTCSWGSVTVSHTIVSIAKVELQAQQAAHQAVDVNDACPYPFHTTAGYVFRNAFLAERNAMLMPPSVQPSGQPGGQPWAN